MLTQELLVTIHILYQQGMSIRAIAKHLRLSRNTVKRYLHHPERLPIYNARPLKESILEPFKPYLRERIEAARPDWIPASVLFREIQSRGYQGQSGLVRNYVRIFKTTSNETVVRFETEPGEQLQVDYTTIRRGHNPLKALVATLGYSRASYVRFSQYERQDDWLTGIREAFHFFGGVPKHLLLDNAKCLVLEHNGYGKGQHRWNPALWDLAKTYGCQLRACRPYRAQTKGKVERFNGYLKRSFVLPLATTLKQSGLELDVEMANAQVGAWLMDIAHQRIHGTTGEQPQVLWDKERHDLQALPSACLTPVIPVVSQDQNTSMAPMPMESLQHPLKLYDGLLEDAL